MGNSDRKEKERELRRNDIIDGAERIFFTKGYEKATMDEVAKEAEYSKRTVYIYFNSKEQIYFEIMIRGYKLLINMVNQSLRKGTINAIEEIRQIAYIIRRFNIEHPNYFNAIMEYENGELDFQKGISDQSRDECYALGEQILTILVEALKKGVREKTIRREVEITKTALILWACMIGVFNVANKKERYMKQYHNLTSEELISAAFELLINSIKN